MQALLGLHEWQFQETEELRQRIIYWTGIKTRQISYRMFVIANKIEELFAPTLNGITASVWRVFFYDSRSKH